MNLFLLRHGKACARSPKWRPDSTRPLTRDGEKKMFAVARGIQSLDLNFDLILTSPYIRAFRTAEILGEVFESKKVFETKNLIPDAEPKAVIEEINGNFSSLTQIVLVGHEPSMTRLISVLLSGKDDLSIHAAELEFRIGQDEPVPFRVRRRPGIEVHGQPPQLSSVRRAYRSLHALVGDVLVVLAVLALGCRREDRLRKSRSVQVARRQRDAAHSPLCLVFLPSRSGQVSARHAFHREHGCALHQHRAALKLFAVRLQRGGKLRHVGRDQVVWHKVMEQLEPEQRNLCQDLAFARDARAEHVIECRDAVSGHQQQRAVYGIQIAHLAASQ